MLNLAPRVLRGDFAPGFYVKHFVKDIGLALDVCKEQKISLPGLELAAKLLRHPETVGRAAEVLERSLDVVDDPERRDTGRDDRGREQRPGRQLTAPLGHHPPEPAQHDDPGHRAEHPHPPQQVRPGPAADRARRPHGWRRPAPSAGRRTRPRSALRH